MPLLFPCFQIRATARSHNIFCKDGAKLRTLPTLLLILVGFFGTGAAAVPDHNTKVPGELERRLETQRKAVQSGNPAQIVDASQKLVAQALLELGRWRSREAAYAQALALFRGALALEDTPQLRELAAEAQAHSGERVQIFAADPADPAAPASESDLARAKLSAAQLREGNLREKHLRKILGAGYNDWGTAEAQQEQYSEALSAFRQAERWNPSTPDLMRNLGMAAMKVGDNGAAARALQIATEQDPSNKDLRSLLAVAEFSLGDYERAAKSFGAIRDHAQTDPNMAYAWAFSLSRSNQLQQAVAVLDRLNTQTLSAEMLVSVGHLYSELGGYEQALNCFRKALQQDASITKAHDGAGVALIRMDRPSEAVPELEAELKLNPDDPDAQYQLAYALLQLSKKAEAMSLLRSLVTTHPDHARAHYQLGKEMLEGGHTDEAITNLEAAATLDPDRAYVHYQLQAAYRRAGRAADADRELKIYRELKERDRQRASVAGAHEGKATE